MTQEAHPCTSHCENIHFSQYCLLLPHLKFPLRPSLQRAKRERHHKKTKRSRVRRAAAATDMTRARRTILDKSATVRARGMAVDPAQQDAAQRSDDCETRYRIRRGGPLCPPFKPHRIAQRSLNTLLQIPKAARTPPGTAAPRYSEGESWPAIARSAST